MLILASTSDKIQVVIGSAGSINVHASWLDNNAGAVTPGRTNLTASTATTLDAVGSPASGVQRTLNSLFVRNLGGSANDITVRHTDGSVIAELKKVTLGAGATLQYNDGDGFK